MNSFFKKSGVYMFLILASALLILASSWIPAFIAVMMLLAFGTSCLKDPGPDPDDELPPD